MPAPNNRNNSSGDFANDAYNFFSNNSPEDINAQDDNKSDNEENALFNGSLESLGDWILHQKFILDRNDRDQERDLRKENAKKAFKLTAWWAGFIALIILLKGFGNLPWICFELNQAEFLFVIGSLTTSIFFFYLLVMKYLFYRKSKNNSRPDG